MSKVILEFPNDESRKKWLGWWLDASGEQDWWEFCDLHEIYLHHKYPVDSVNHDQRMGASKIKNDAVIKFYEYEPCHGCHSSKEDCVC